jgi:methyl-accepting chemotaxis protein
MFLNRLRISGKVGIVISMFVLLCACLTTFSILTVSRVSKDMGASMGANIETAKLAIFIRQDFMATQHAVLTALIDGRDGASSDISAVQTAGDNLRRETAQVQQATQNQYPALTSAMVENSAAYDRFLRQYLDLIRSGDFTKARQLVVTTGTTTYDRGGKAFGDLLAAMGPAELAAGAKAAQAVGRVLWLVIAASALVMGLIAILAFMGLQRGLSRPLEAITGAMNRLAEGDLEATVDERPRGDEVGDLARAFIAFRQAAVDKQRTEAEAAEQRHRAETQQREHDEMRAAIAGDQALVVNALAGGLSQLAGGDLIFRLGTAFPPSYETLRRDFNEAMDRLQDAMTTISGAALGISAGAEEVSRSATDLSQRTEQQAASLEETAAALDQITTAVRRTADGAAEVKQAVATATADAAASGQVVRDTIAAISEIQQSSRQVSQIIGVIDEIAFQTNLLALNAGVEAARAGEAGRGFAVVATEVRALAQRSAVAAKEIKALISTSGGQVDTGVQLVAQTGVVLERIHTSVNQIHDLVAGIAASAQEQASGLDEVNNAVDQMDRITQQNAALVEESTAASFALASESQQLTSLIGRFGIGADQRATAQSASFPRQRPAPVFRRASGRAATAQKLDAVDADDWQEF